MAEGDEELNILCADTSTNNCSIAVITENTMLGEMDINFDLQHSVLLMPMIEELMARLRLSPKDIDALCVSKGPGSFTGLRIGMAALKGMALALGKPMYSSTSLETLAFGAFGAKGIVCPMLDALRGAYYAAFYRFEDGRLIAMMQPEVLTPEEIAERLKDFNEEVLVMGELKTKDLEFLASKGLKVVKAPPAMDIPKASNLGYCMLDRIMNGDSENPDELVPLYIRKSQAEHEYEKKRGRLNG
jgi:tRNA threonylcarbamoyl adenosine modification protein YeaZ